MTLTDNENPADKYSDDADVADAYDGSYYVSDGFDLNNSHGVAGPDGMPGMGGQTGGPGDMAGPDGMPGMGGQMGGPGGMGGGFWPGR